MFFIGKILYLIIVYQLTWPNIDYCLNKYFMSSIFCHCTNLCFFSLFAIRFKALFSILACAPTNLLICTVCNGFIFRTVVIVYVSVCVPTHVCKGGNPRASGMLLHYKTVGSLDQQQLRMEAADDKKVASAWLAAMHKVTHIARPFWLCSVYCLPCILSTALTSPGQVIYLYFFVNIFCLSLVLVL